MFEKSPNASSRSAGSLVLSLSLHGVAVIAIFLAHYSIAPAPRREATVRLFAPAPAPAHASAPIRKPAAIRAPKRFIPPAAAKLAIPAPIVPEAPAIQALPSIAIPAPPTIVAAEAPPAPKPIEPPAVPVRTGVFANAAAVTKGAPNTAAQVRTGGFAGASAGPDAARHTAQVSAAGFGDAGIAGNVSTRRAVASAGFGDASSAAISTGGHGAVRAGGFGDAVAAAPPVNVRRAAAAASPVTAARILDKPRPAYTEEARRLQIEGEVQLEVVFGASGEIQILRVVRGLGHGLDENAALAAKSIRFLPARREGHAVDSTATVHILFQLAS